MICRRWTLFLAPLAALALPACATLPEDAPRAAAAFPAAPAGPPDPETRRAGGPARHTLPEGAATIAARSSSERRPT